MDRGHEALVYQGLTQVYTGLGILLGAGKISSSTHSQITGLLNAEDSMNISYPATDAAPRPFGALSQPPGLAGKETPVSLRSNDLGADLGLNDKTGVSRVSAKSSVPASPRGHDRDSWRAVGAPPPSAQQQPPHSRSHPSSSDDLIIICPWWSTPGMKCRESKTAGGCPFYHEDMPNGIKDPLICSFWADGGRCTKTDDECKFCHYPSQHRQIAPLPNYSKKSKKNKGGGGHEHRISSYGNDGWL